MTQANFDLRKQAKKANVPLWAIAEKLGISEPTMTRRMRRELSEQERSEIIGIIEEISGRKEAANGDANAND